MFKRLFFSLLFFTVFCFNSWADEKKTNSVDQENITVTAQKQEQNVQDVPISISVFSGSDLEDMRIENIEDIAAYTPNVMIFSNGTSGFTPPTVRGLNTNVEALSTTLGLYVDGIPVLSGVGFDEVLMDVERVEVLKGPQGTLYGKNAEAGVINVVSRTPGNEGRSSVSMELGEDHKQQFKFSASGPIIKDVLAIGVSGLSYEKDGFIENTYTGEKANDRKHTYGKIHLRATPTDNLAVSLIASRLKYNDGDSDMNMGQGAKDREVQSGFQGYNHASSTMGALKVNYKFSNFTFESVSTSRVYEDDAGGDYDFTPAELFHNDKDAKYKKLSQEFRLSRQGQKLNWIFGVYGDKDDNHLKFKMKGLRPSFDDKHFDGHSIGVFAHFDWAISKHFSLLSGIRYDTEEKSYENDALGIDTDKDFEEISPKIAVQYRVNPDLMFYLSASKGYQAGGFNTLSPAGYPLAYEEEKLWSYEFGSKTSFFNNRVNMSAAVYYMDIEDMQVNNSVDALRAYRSNAAEATSKGIEFEINAKLTDALKVFAAYGYNKIEFDSFADALGNYKDNVNPFAPEYNYNVGVEYRDIRGIYGRCDVNGYGEMYFDKKNDFERDAYNLVNLKLGYESEKFDIYLYGKNIFDKEYDSDGYYSGYYTIYSPPREIGISTTWRF